ncbi:hypothetical protein QY97_00457 [Bacillus thermotolerans]|uniref:Uncharacterized protein n=1 Tax=Bacillus thermotolerans TaxID=1221996 RepID=A0A0F5IC48_BACTR|nr:hypothetical protein QY97_00457 [Bacillus thermotolerans]KKB41917.1 hypothetical protein QY96_01819 [Bacillus thermotolerans]KKB43076.1 hypothetical protein QY95_02676 [Bacillus thermotolerans]
MNFPLPPYLAFGEAEEVMQKKKNRTFKKSGFAYYFAWS